MIRFKEIGELSFVFLFSVALNIWSFPGNAWASEIQVHGALDRAEFFSLPTEPELSDFVKEVQAAITHFDRDQLTTILRQLTDIERLWHEDSNQEYLHCRRLAKKYKGFSLEDMSTSYAPPFAETINSLKEDRIKKFANLSISSLLFRDDTERDDIAQLFSYQNYKVNLAQSLHHNEHYFYPTHLAIVLPVCKKVESRFSLLAKQPHSEAIAQLIKDVRTPGKVVDMAQYIAELANTRFPNNVENSRALIELVYNGSAKHSIPGLRDDLNNDRKLKQLLIFVSSTLDKKEATIRSFLDKCDLVKEEISALIVKNYDAQDWDYLLSVDLPAKRNNAGYGRSSGGNNNKRKQQSQPQADGEISGDHGHSNGDFDEGFDLVEKASPEESNHYKISWRHRDDLLSLSVHRRQRICNAPRQIGAYQVGEMVPFVREYRGEDVWKNKDPFHKISRQADRFLIYGRFRSFAKAVQSGKVETHTFAHVNGWLTVCDHATGDPKQLLWGQLEYIFNKDGECYHRFFRPLQATAQSS